ncbi:MAG: 8-oxoguanine DNA glycosylase [Clostridiaceae bacterium]|jgi:N-glycosylase/DNA lyase|nr:8-oxoguanine DNA glycosylase [Clostridiaceae bacterium]
MHYRGYDVHEDGSGVIVEGVRDFDLVHTFECGQCFRWYREPDGSYTGVVRGRVANVSYSPGVLKLDNVTIEDFRQVWFDYFDLGRDYGLIKKAVTTDGIMERAVESGSGIRILRQEPWETLVSFIISANNRIPRIMKIISEISRLFGTEIKYAGKSYYSFPDARTLASSSIEQVSECRAGYRCGYIHETAVVVAGSGFDTGKLAAMPAADARKELMKYRGVGAKVADCVLLYSGARYDVFPVDVWVKRVMEELYFGREASFPEIHRFAAERFGKYAGFAQQYLFYYAREHKIGV